MWEQLAASGAAGLGGGGGAEELFSTGQNTWGWLPIDVDLLRREEQLLAIHSPPPVQAYGNSCYTDSYI